MKNKKFVLIVLIPIFLHLMIFMIGPIIGGLAISFFDYNPLRSDNHFVGLDNFVRLVQDPVFWKATKNTLFFVVITVALNIVISLGIAQLISMFKSNKTRSLFRMIFFLPCVAPLVASSVVWAKSILPTTNGLANMALRTLGLAEVNWLGNPDVLMWSIIVFSIWQISATTSSSLRQVSMESLVNSMKQLIWMAPADGRNSVISHCLC